MGQPDPRVDVHTKCVIAPATPTTAADVFLSSLDIFWHDIHYNRRLLFFREGGIPTAVAVDVLKRSLSEVLVAYYPWAGRLALDEHQRLVIRCNDAGVEFVEASVDFAMSDLHAQGFQMKPYYDLLSQKLAPKGDTLYTLPLLSVQVTRFTDGGFSLGVTHSHVAADGQSLWNFMLGWGECARGQPLSIQPLHDRRRLAVPEPSEEKAALNFNLPPLEHLDPIVNAQIGADAGTPPDAAAAVKNWTEMASAEDPLVQCVFILPRAAAAKLKAQAGGAFSSYVATCAHFWQRVAAAAQQQPTDATFFATLANFRSRLSPPLPPNYFGNALRVAVNRTAIRNVTGEELVITAQRVNTAVAASRDAEELVALRHWLELHEHGVMDKIEVSGIGVHVASSPWFPMYEVDFGWGPAAAVRSARVQGHGEMVFFGTRAGLGAGDIEICMPLAESTMHRLLQDKDFLAYPPVSPFQ